MLFVFAAYSGVHVLTVHMSNKSIPGFWWSPCFSSFQFFALSYYVSLRSEFRVVMSVTMSAQQRSLIRPNRQLFVGVVMSYLRYLCLFAHSCVLHILSCVFALFCFVLCTLCYKFLWIVYFKSKHILDCTSGVSPSGGGYK